MATPLHSPGQPNRNSDWPSIWAVASICIGEGQDPVRRRLALAHTTDAAAVWNIGAHLQRSGKEALAGGPNGSVVDCLGSVPEGLFDVPLGLAVWRLLSSPNNPARRWWLVTHSLAHCRDCAP